MPGWLRALARVHDPDACSMPVQVAHAPEQISGLGISGLASGHYYRCRYECAASGPVAPFTPTAKGQTGFSCLGLLRPAPLINLPFPSCFCRCCAAALLQLSGLLPSGRETFPGGVDDSRQSVCASEWASGHIRRVNRCRGSGGTPPGSASP